MGYLKNKFKEDNKTIISGDCLHMRSVAHILNLIALENLKDMHNSVAKVRTMVRFVRSSSTWFDKFKVAIRVAGIECKKRLCILIFLQNET